MNTQVDPWRWLSFTYFPTWHFPTMIAEAHSKEVVFYVQFPAIQKHQTRERIFHDPVLFLHPCWELNLGHLLAFPQLYPLWNWYLFQLDICLVFTFVYLFPMTETCGIYLPCACLHSKQDLMRLDLIYFSVNIDALVTVSIWNNTMMMIMIETHRHMLKSINRCLGVKLNPVTPTSLPSL